MDSTIMKIKKSRNKKDNVSIFKNIVFILFIVISLVIVLYHEPWRDEAQSYLLSKLNIVDLFNQLKIEGHPIIWYLVLKITNIPYEAIWILPWSITIISAALIVYKMDKPIINKIIILLSLPIIYVSNVFARSYSLAVLLVTLLAFTYKKRTEHPFIYGTLLFLLINTHIIFIGFIGSLLLIDIYNFIKDKASRKNIAIFLAISILGILFLFFQLHGSTSARSDIFMKDLLLKTNYLEKLNFMTLSITNNSLLAIVFYISLLYLVITLIMKKKYELLTILIVSTLGFVGIISIYSGNTHMHIMYMMILFFIYWQIESNKRINRLIVIIFLCTFLNTTEIVYADFRSYYSPAKITSEYINNNIDKNEKLYCLDTSYCASLIPYNKEYQFIDIRSNESFKYVDWTKNIYLEKDIKEYELSDDQISSIRYIIIPQNFDNKFENNYKTIYISPSSGFESFIILEKK